MIFALRGGILGMILDHYMMMLSTYAHSNCFRGEALLMREDQKQLYLFRKLPGSDQSPANRNRSATLTEKNDTVSLSSKQRIRATTI